MDGWSKHTVGNKELCFKYVGEFVSEVGWSKCGELDEDSYLPLPLNEQENVDFRAGFNAVGATDGVLLGANDLDEVIIILNECQKNKIN